LGRSQSLSRLVRIMSAAFGRSGWGAGCGGDAGWGAGLSAIVYLEWNLYQYSNTARAKRAPNAPTRGHAIDVRTST